MSAIDEVLPGPDDADLPLGRGGTQPSSLTITLLADYGMRHRITWPSAGIVALLGEFGVSPTAARAALSRLSRRGVLQATKTGRRTSYRLTDEAATALLIGGRRIAGFAADAEDWDGRWTLVAFAGTGEGGAPRRLRSRLRWLGYAPLYDGLWISARADPAFTVGSLSGSEPSALTVFRGRDIVLPGADRRPLDAWDLDVVAAEYHRFLRRWDGPGKPCETVDGSAALVARTRLMDDYRRFPALDPQLPQQMMPGDWPRRRAREVFERCYDALGGRAEARVREILALNRLPVPTGLGHHTVDDLTGSMTPLGPERSSARRRADPHR